MTTAMRVIAPQAGPKVLRVGLVMSGRIVEERILKQRVHVTIGAREGVTFAIASPGESAITLFEVVGDGYRLNLEHGMRARVALASGVRDVVGPCSVSLDADTRGKITVGAATFVFQFVPPPPPAVRPQLPLGVRRGVAATMDWNLTIIAAFSFLAHFGFIGAMYSDWSDPVVRDDISIGPLIDHRSNDTQPDVESVPVPVSNAAAQTEMASANTNTRTPESRTRTRTSTSTRLSEAAEALEVGMILSFRGPAATRRALDRSDAPMPDLTDAARADRGAIEAMGELKLGGERGGLVRPGQRSGLEGIAVTGRSGNENVGPDERLIKAPTGIAEVGETKSSAVVPSAERVIAGLRTKLKRCYDRGLQVDSTMSGSVVLATKIAPNGEVKSADAQSVSGLSPTVVSCLQRVVESAQFDAPAGGGATLNIPVKFVQSR